MTCEVVFSLYRARSPYPIAWRKQRFLSLGKSVYQPTQGMLLFIGLTSCIVLVRINLLERLDACSTLTSTYAMTTIDAVIVVLDAEPFSECLHSLSHLDHIYVLADDQSVLESARNDNVTTLQIGRPPCIEEIGNELLLLTNADWVLLIDPDERLLCADAGTLRRQLTSTSMDCVGYRITYEFSLFGHRLSHTYADLHKAKLVRPRCVRWPSSIHSLPGPISSTTYVQDLPGSILSIDTDLARDVRHRLARHVQWASLEARLPASPLDLSKIAEVLASVFEEYFVRRSCDADGTAGVLNGLLHLNKSIAGLLLQAEAHGLAEASSSDVAYLLGNMFREYAERLTHLSKEVQ
jgi:hypothetical protein